MIEQRHETFYNENTQHGRMRARSPEVDFGALWISGKEPFPRYRVSWIKDTGEVYAIRFEGATKLYRVLGTVPNRKAVERVLSGWVVKCGEPHGIEWVQERLREEKVNATD